MKEKVLDLVNRARRALGWSVLADLPQGEKGSCYECPLARSLGAVIGYHYAYFTSENQAQKVAKAWRRRVEYLKDPNGDMRPSVHLPSALENFVLEFERDKYPELIEEEEYEEEE